MNQCQPVPSCPERQTQTEEQLGIVEQSVIRLCNSLGRIEGRLENVLRIEPLRPAGDAECSKVPELVRMADRIRTINDEILSAEMRVESMLDRLEL